MLGWGRGARDLWGLGVGGRVHREFLGGGRGQRSGSRAPQLREQHVTEATLLENRGKFRVVEWGGGPGLGGCARS